MTDAVTEPHQPSVTALRHRIPGQAVIEQVLALQEETAPRSWWQRLLGASPLSDEARPWFKGAIGEIAVGELLAQLGPEWRVLHAVPVGKASADIDHVLIGPAGVFMLNTKNHSGQSVWVAGRTLMIAGQKQHHIARAHHEAARAGKLLTTVVGEPVPVTAVLVLVSFKSLTVKQKPAGVTVLTDRQLVRWLRRQRPVLTSDMTTRITSAAELPGTGHDYPQPPLDPAVLLCRFTALRTSVRAHRQATAPALAAGAATRSHHRPAGIRPAPDRCCTERRPVLRLGICRRNTHGLQRPACPTPAVGRGQQARTPWCDGDVHSLPPKDSS